MAISIFHVFDHTPSEIEAAFDTIITQGAYVQLLRIEGTFSAVRTRLLAFVQEAKYHYLILRPGPGSAWTPVLQLGTSQGGLEATLSKLLGGCSVFSTFVSDVYGEFVSGYRLSRAGTEIDRYASDPSLLRLLRDEQENAEDQPLEDDAAEDDAAGYEQERGHPERFADLLPAGTTAQDFSRVVLQPGWWEEYDRALDGDPLRASAESETGDLEGEDSELGDGMAEEEEGYALLVDEMDRMRCIALALELWGPSEYPFAQDVEDIPNRLAGPAIAIAFG